MPGARTTDIQLPNAGPPDPSIPGRLQRQNDLALQRSSKAYESKPIATDADATSLNPLRRLASKVRAVSGRSMSSSRR